MPEPCGGGVDHSSDLGAAVAGTEAGFSRQPGFGGHPGSGWPRWLPGTAGTGFWQGRSSGTGGFPIGPAAPAGAPPPRSAAGTRQRPRSAAGRGPAVTALPAGAVAPFVPYPVLPPRTGTAGGIPRRPPRRIGRPLNGKSDPFGRCAVPPAPSSG